MKKYVDVYTVLKLVFILSNIYQYCSSTIPCSSRKQNCSLCLIDGECGFCDSCGDHCHQPQTLHSLQNCTGCAQCVPGTLIGPKKGYECRHEWLVYFEFLVKTKLFGFFFYLLKLFSDSPPKFNLVKVKEAVKFLFYVSAWCIRRLNEECECLS